MRLVFLTASESSNMDTPFDDALFEEAQTLFDEHAQTKWGDFVRMSIKEGKEWRGGGWEFWYVEGVFASAAAAAAAAASGRPWLLQPLRNGKIGYRKTGSHVVKNF